MEYIKVKKGQFDGVDFWDVDLYSDDRRIKTICTLYEEVCVFAVANEIAYILGLQVG